ncbi:MAG: hypothetical protein PUD22_00340 [Erysipelotrichaceae bacterium]|nr:hypothetical protein [Erysipelotrichaceae bacterium]
MNVEELYRALGANYLETKKRMGTESMIGKFIIKFLDEPTSLKLARAMEENDIVSVFMYAHTLKGVVMNLGLSNLYNESDDNPLRNVIEISRPFTSNDDCEEAIEQLKPHVHAYLDEYNRTLELIESYDKEN